MKKIFWKPEYSVGVERLDRQHQKIISVINKLIAKPRVFRTSGTIADVLMELNGYVSATASGFSYRSRDQAYLLAQ